MAIYFADLKTISRARGDSLAAALAYRTGACIVDQRTGVTHDYSRKAARVLDVLTVAPDHAGEATIVAESDAAGLWAAAEAAETRKNSMLAREIVLAVPHEIPLDRQKMCARNFAAWLSERLGVAATVALHAPGRGGGDDRNVHAHVIFSTRKATIDVRDHVVSFGAKTRELNDKGTSSKIVEEMRAEWAKFVNADLEKAQCEARVDHRSYERQGVKKLAKRHVGRRAAALERKGISTAIGDYNRAVEVANETARDLAEAKARLEAAKAAAQAVKRAAEPPPAPTVDAFTAALREGRKKVAARAAAEAAAAPRSGPAPPFAARQAASPPPRAVPPPSPAQAAAPKPLPPAPATPAQGPTQLEREAFLKSRIGALPDDDARFSACDLFMSTREGRQPRAHSLPVGLARQIVAVAVAASAEMVAWVREARARIAQASTRLRLASRQRRDGGLGIG